MDDAIIEKIVNGVPLEPAEKEEFTFLLRLIGNYGSTKSLVDSLFRLESAEPLATAPRMYAFGLVAGTGSPPDFENTDFTGTFLIYPPITLPNGDTADIGGMFQGKIMWYGNSTTGKLVAAGSQLILDFRGLTSTSQGVLAQVDLGDTLLFYMGGLRIQGLPKMGMHSISLSGVEMITNGDFETGDFTGWTQVGTPTIANDSPSGLYCVLVDQGTNYIKTTLTTVSGLRYLIRFNYKIGTGEAVPTWNGVGIDSDAATDDADGSWRSVLYSYLATGTSTVISFQSYGGTCYIDNISVMEQSGLSSMATGLTSTAIAEWRVSDLIDINAGRVSFTLTGDLKTNVPIDIAESSPGTPDNGYGSFYPKSNGLPYFKNDSGVEIGLAGGDGWIPSPNSWSYSSGIRTQAYTNDPAAGASIVLNMTNTAGFLVGDSVTVSSSAGSEVARIDSIVANTSITVNALALNHTTTSPLVTLNENTFVISVNADVTALIGVGDRIKLTQTTTKYFGVQAVGSYSGGATLITVFGGTDYTLANAAITNPFYSHAKTPFGWPADPNKWAVLVSDSNRCQKVTPTQNVWYGGTGLSSPGPSIRVPIGCWYPSYKALLDTFDTTVTDYNIYATLSTANNTEADTDMTTLVVLTTPSGTYKIWNTPVMQRALPITVSANETRYLNIKTSTTTSDNIDIRGDALPTILRLAWAYL